MKFLASFVALSAVIVATVAAPTPGRSGYNGIEDPDVTKRGRSGYNGIEDPVIVERGRSGYNGTEDPVVVKRGRGGYNGIEDPAKYVASALAL